MYKQSAFGRVRPRNMRIPENYSGNAFGSEERIYDGEAVEREETIAEKEETFLLPESKPERTQSLFDGFGEKFSGESLILLLVLAVLLLGDGKKDDGAILAVLLLLLI